MGYIPGPQVDAVEIVVLQRISSTNISPTVEIVGKPPLHFKIWNEVQDVLDGSQQDLTSGLSVGVTLSIYGRSSTILGELYWYNTAPHGFEGYTLYPK